MDNDKQINDNPKPATGTLNILEILSDGTVAVREVTAAFFQRLVKARSAQVVIGPVSLSFDDREERAK